MAAANGAKLATAAPLEWAPPVMHAPVIVDLALAPTQEWWRFPLGQDAIFLGADTVRTASLGVTGGHNIMVLGGDYQPAGGGHAMAFYDTTGTVWIDGAVIDMKKTGAGANDGIDIAGNAASPPDLYVQNTRIVNVHGSYSKAHSDAVQTQGPAGELGFYNVTATTDYQGIFIAPQYQPAIKSATLDNVNLRYTGPVTDTGSAYSYLLWTLDDPKLEKPYPITFDNVYVEPRAGQSAIADAVWPDGAAGAVQHGDHIGWPGLPYSGSVTVGSHADFADGSMIGLDFHDAPMLIDAASHGWLL